MRHDANRSGAIEEPELRACLQENGFSTETATKVARDWLPVYDIDENNTLSLEEFETLHTTLIQEVANTEVTLSDVVDILKKIDKNENNTLSLEEFETLHTTLIQ